MDSETETNEDLSYQDIPKAMIGWGILLMLIVTLCIIIYEAYVWLKMGVWPDIPLSTTLYYLNLSYPRVEWLGIQKIIDWLLNGPISAWSFFVGLLLIFIGSKRLEYVSTEEFQKEMQQKLKKKNITRIELFRANIPTVDEYEAQKAKKLNK